MVKRLVLLVFTLALGAGLSCDYAGPGGASTTMKASPPTIERTPGTAGASTTMEAAPATTERTRFLGEGAGAAAQRAGGRHGGVRGA